MNSRKIDRRAHDGKNGFEKEAYKNFLASKLSLDKTEGESVDINKTNESSFEEGGMEPKKIQKKSSQLKIKDFFYDNWVIALFGGFIVGLSILFLTGYISINREQGVQGEKIQSMEDRIKVLDDSNKENLNGYNLIKEDFNVFKAEISKDVEYIGKQLELYK